MRAIINSTDAPEPIGPYSQALRFNNLMFVSGQIGLNAHTGEMENRDIETETRRVMDNIKAILKEEGWGFENIVKTTIFLKNMDDFAKVNEVYASCIKMPYPARETVEVSRLPKDANVEISVIAGG